MLNLKPQDDFRADHGVISVILQHNAQPQYAGYIPNNLISQSKLLPFAKKSLTSNGTVEILAVAVVSF